MIDPRGGALTLGLGLIEQLAVLPHADTWSPEKAHRTFSLAAGGLRIAAIDEQTALIRDPDGDLADGRGRRGDRLRRRQAGRPRRPTRLAVGPAGRRLDRLSPTR